MPWVRIDDQFPEHPKVDAAGPLAGWLYVCALAYSNRALTDGFVSDSALLRLASITTPKKHAAKLVEVGLWDRVDGGYQVHDYLKYQKPRVDILREREQAAARQARFRNRHAGSNAVTNSGSSGEATHSPLPRPSNPVSDNSTRVPEVQRDHLAPVADFAKNAAKAREVRTAFKSKSQPRDQGGRDAG